MADLLTMTNMLLGSAIAGNLYTDVSEFNGLLYKFAAPPIAQEQAATFNVPVPRNQIYAGSNSPDQDKTPPTDIPTQVSNVQSNLNYSEQYAFSDTARADLYAFHQNAVKAGGASVNLPNGTPISQPTLADAAEQKGTPPVQQLWKVKNGDNANTFAPPQGQIQNKSFYGGNDYDDQGFDFIKRVGPFKLFPEGTAPLYPFDVGAIAHWLRDVGREVYFLPRPDVDPTTQKGVGTTPETISKSITWLASQFLLASLNPGDPQAYGLTNMLWNPLSLPLSSIPGVAALGDAFGYPVNAITVGAVLGNYRSNIGTSIAAGANVGLERLLLMRQGAYSPVAPVERLTKLKSPVAKPGYYGDIAADGYKTSNNLEDEGIPLINGISVASQVDGSEQDFAKLLGFHTNLYDSTKPYDATTAIMPQEVLEQQATATGAPPEKIKLSSLFVDSNYPPEGTKSLMPNFWRAKSQLFSQNGVPRSSLADAPGVGDITDGLSADFANEDTNNLINTNPIPETDIYLPFMFQDLRKVDPSVSQDQFLYFRAFLKPGMSELFTPEWQIERYYGRVDQVPTYIGTTRNINVSFDVVAWQPSDLPIIWNKMQKLQSMVYPVYNGAGFMSAGPIIRMRIGDIIATSNNRGIPGYITSMNWDYDDNIWNMLTDWKVPRKISVSLGFTVLHEGNPGIYPYSQATLDPLGNLASGPTTQPNNPSTGQTSNNTPAATFGAATFTAQGQNTTVKVSPSDIRKIFGGNGGSTSGAGKSG